MVTEEMQYVVGQLQGYALQKIKWAHVMLLYCKKFINWGGEACLDLLWDLKISTGITTLLNLFVSWLALTMLCLLFRLVSN
jgi:hypothetical protein